MPAKAAKATKAGKAAKARKAAKKPGHLGSARRETKPARKARGIQHSSRPLTLDPTIHPKKSPPQRRSSAGQVAVTTPNVPGYSNNVDADKYGAMKDILLKVLPRKSPGMTQGEMFEAVRGAASHGAFPGSTHRWWAKSVQLDLEAKGALVREASSPLRWHVR